MTLNNRNVMTTILMFKLRHCPKYDSYRCMFTRRSILPNFIAIGFDTHCDNNCRWYQRQNVADCRYRQQFVATRRYRRQFVAVDLDASVDKTHSVVDLSTLASKTTATNCRRYQYYVV